MMPFRQATQEIFRAFFDSIYKTSRFTGDFQQVEIDALETLMREKMKNPLELFEILTGESKIKQQEQIKTPDKKTKIQEERTGKSKFSQSDEYSQEQIDYYQDDLQEFGNHKVPPLSIKLENLPSSLFKIEQLYKPQQMAKIQSNIQPQSSQEEEEQQSQSQSYDLFLKKIRQASEQSKRQCKLHIGGVYIENTIKSKASKKVQYKYNPVILIKERQTLKQFVMVHCQSALKQGDVEQLFETLKKEQQEKKLTK